jgi:hypothetical protein
MGFGGIRVEAFRLLAISRRGPSRPLLKATPAADGSPGVFYPGEVEYLREQERRVSGIDVEDATWDKLRALAREYGLVAQLDLA